MTDPQTTKSPDNQTYDLDKTDAERCDVDQASNAGQQQRDSRRDGTLTTPRPPVRYSKDHAAWLADKIHALGDYAKEAADVLNHWPEDDKPLQDMTLDELQNAICSYMTEVQYRILGCPKKGGSHG